MPTPRPIPSVRPGQRIYMIGIGGCGMSGLARLLQSSGASVAGSDRVESVFTKQLRAEGFEIGDDREDDPRLARADVVVISAAVPADHPQLMAVAELGVETLTYAEMLGRCTAERTGVAIAGTHGKSTTTAMLGWALAQSGLDPSVIVGATCPQLCPGGGGFRLGADRVPSGPREDAPGLLVVEACEFNRSFHALRPTVAAITNVEADHLDVYGSLEGVIEAFREFAALAPPASDGGEILIGHEHAHRREITAGVGARLETIGYSPEADWAVAFDPDSGATTLSNASRGVRASWRSPLPGAHNAMNAAFAVALAVMLGAEPADAAHALETFEGLERRTHRLGTRGLARGGAVRVWDDYGHHPTEIDATLRALRRHERIDDEGGRLICVFQPHQHSRTRFLLDEFATAFGAADLVVVPHIYFVRDSQVEKTKVSASDLVDRLRGLGKRAIHAYPFDAIVELLDETCADGDVLVVMGAGPVDAVARTFLAGAPEAAVAGKAS